MKINCSDDVNIGLDIITLMRNGCLQVLKMDTASNGSEGTGSSSVLGTCDGADHWSSGLCDLGSISDTSFDALGELLEAESQVLEVSLGNGIEFNWGGHGISLHILN